MSYYDPSQHPQQPQQPPQTNWQQPSGPNWPPQQSGQLPSQYTQYPNQQPQTGPGMPPLPQYTQYPPYQQPPGVPPQYPMPPQQPPRQPGFFSRKVGCLPMWALILIIAVFACGGINAMANAGRNTTTTLTDAQIAATNSAQLAATNSAQGTTDTPVPTATLNASIPTSTPAPTQAPAKWTTTHTYTGSGSKKTGTISVPSDWKIFWKCTPSSFYGGSYNVIVEVYNSDGSLADGAINTICKTGNTGDSTEEHQGGDVYLDIQSEGDWVITVQEFK